MKRKKWTPEERLAWWEAREASIRDLRGRAGRIKAELEAKKKLA